MIQLTSGYVRKTYNNQRTSLTIAGNANLGSLSLTITMKIDVTVNMSDVTFAIPWMYDIHIGDGTTATTLTAPYDYKILPGASITVEKNATLTTSKSIIVYSSFTDTSFGGSVYPENRRQPLLSTERTTSTALLAVIYNQRKQEQKSLSDQKQN